MGAVERSRTAKRVGRSEVILRPLAAETFILLEMIDIFCVALLSASSKSPRALAYTNLPKHQEDIYCVNEDK